ncbi:MAG: hypothetical protein AAGE37_06865 [Pseudomonadota bacterium]
MNRTDHLITRAAQFFDHPRFRNAGEAIAKKRSGLGLVFWFTGLAGRLRLGNMALIVFVTLFYGVFRRPLSGPVFQYGMSANNIRSFRRINACAGRSDLDERINGVPLPLRARLRALGSVKRLWHVSGVLRRHKASNGFSRAQLVICGAAWLIYSTEDLSEIRVLCVASDHSPIKMALLHIARERQIQTCYLQHAPVADYFPPLDYDLAVLFDEHSHAIYQRAAAHREVESRASVQILPPFEENASPMRLDSPPFRTGIFLSYLFDAPALEKLILILSGHPGVSDIFIRRHPRCKADLSDLLARPCVFEPPHAEMGAFLDKCDLALVPNSGAAIEALHLGVPTFYTPGMDGIEYDYYGFVAEGIVPLFDPAVLADSEQVTRFFDKEWKQQFARYDSTVKTDLGVARQAAGEAYLELMR